MSLLLHKKNSKASNLTSNVLQKISDSNNSFVESPILTKFKAQLVTSEAFNIMYKKIKDGVITQSSESYEKVVENLGRMSGLTKD